MKRYLAFSKKEEKNGKLLYPDGSLYATEARFDIITRDEQRALELIDENGEDSKEFYLEETSGVKDQMGRYFPESIKDARI